MAGEKTHRTPIHAWPGPRPNVLHVICDDGSVWKSGSHGADEYEELRPVPGSRRAAELAAPAKAPPRKPAPKAPAKDADK